MFTKTKIAIEGKRCFWKDNIYPRIWALKRTGANFSPAPDLYRKTFSSLIPDTLRRIREAGTWNPTVALTSQQDALWQGGPPDSSLLFLTKSQSLELYIFVPYRSWTSAHQKLDRTFPSHDEHLLSLPGCFICRPGFYKVGNLTSLKFLLDGKCNSFSCKYWAVLKSIQKQQGFFSLRKLCQGKLN